MQHFTYQAYESSGALKSGELTASDRTQALQQLRGLGLVPSRLESRTLETKFPWWQKELTFRRKVSRHHLATVSRELAMLLLADLPMDEALEIVSLQPALDRRMRSVVDSMRHDVVGGASLGQAMERHQTYFPGFFPRLIRAGESSGALAECLEDIGRFLEATDASRSKILAALLYPAILVIASAVALAVVAGILLPAIVPLILDAGADLPPAIAVLDSFTTILSTHWPIIAITTALTLVALGLGYALSPAVRFACSTSLLPLPIVGRIIRHSAVMRYSRTLAMLLRNGVPVLEALSSAAAAVDNSALRHRLADADRLVGGGRSFSNAMREIDVLPALAIRLIALGEQTGELPRMLDRTADIYLASVRQRLDRMTVLIAPVMTLVIGLVVGALVLSVLSALMSINNLAL